MIFLGKLITDGVCFMRACLSWRFCACAQFCKESPTVRNAWEKGFYSPEMLNNAWFSFPFFSTCRKTWSTNWMEWKSYPKNNKILQIITIKKRQRKPSKFQWFFYLLYFFIHVCRKTILDVVAINHQFLKCLTFGAKIQTILST